MADSTTRIALSVSTSSSGSPRRTGWPTSTSHFTSVTVSSTVATSGIRITTSIRDPSAVAELTRAEAPQEDRPTGRRLYGLSAAAEQSDAFEHGVADRAAAGDEDIFRPADAQQAVRVGALDADRRPHGVEIPPLEVGAVVDLGHAQRDGLAQRIGGDPGAAVQDERDLDPPADLGEPVQVQARLAAGS